VVGDCYIPIGAENKAAWDVDRVSYPVVCGEISTLTTGRFSRSMILRGSCQVQVDGAWLKCWRQQHVLRRFISLVGTFMDALTPRIILQND
jgi:hypothetical protein